MTNKQGKYYNSTESNRSFEKKQYFSLLISLLIGLITGLGIAVAIILIITKSPIPFVNKVTKQEYTELPYKQIIDPNHTLHHNQNIIQEKFKNKNQESKKLTSPNKSNTFNIKTMPTVNTDQIIEEKLSVNTKWLYYLQTNIFYNQDDADNMRAKLALLGFEAKISENLFDSGTLYRVQIGPFFNVEQINQIQNNLLVNNINTAIIRTLD